jgi:hypothetical protein
MGYAFENTPWHELLPEEQLSIWIMKAAIADSFLTYNERAVCLWAIDDMKKKKRVVAPVNCWNCGAYPVVDNKCAHCAYIHTPELINLMNNIKEV